MKALIFILVMLFSSISYAENWTDFKHKTKVGALYAATCLYCNDNGRYNNDENGYWKCTNDNSNMSSAIYHGRKEAIFAAIIGRFKAQ